MRRVVGCMTGTSLDGLDAALVEIEGSGLVMRTRFVRGASVGLGACAGVLRALAGGAAVTARDMARAMREFSCLHARAVRELVGAAGGGRCDLVCAHGQTVFHGPPDSWQVLQPAWIAREVGAPVVSDLRAADITAGGQGAPITPIADWVLFRRGGATAVVNLGGFANFTAWGGEGGADSSDREPRIVGGDICACNQLLDGLARERLGEAFDRGGECALRGRADAAARVALARLLATQADARRSLGTGDELAAWVAGDAARLSTEDALRTACEAIADAISPCVSAACERVLLGGGGVRNAALVAALAARLGGRMSRTDDAGVPAEYREAACFAVLGALCQDGVAITIPEITRCPGAAPTAGAWVYPP